MKIAIIHDCVEEYSGATKVLIDFLNMFPGADLYTLFIDKNEEKNGVIYQKAGRVTCSWIDRVPLFKKLPFSFSLILFYSVFFWESIDLSNYDLVISSTTGMGANGVITNDETLHISYVHTPSRRLYADREFMKEVNSHWKGRFISSFIYPRRIWDYIAAQRPDIYVANSKYTQRRVKKFYRRKSVVVYPGIVGLKPIIGDKNYYIYFGRVTKLKGLELIIDAFNQNKKRLVVIGTGSKISYFQSISNHNIEFVGFVERNKLRNILSHAKACVFATRSEDFGLVIPEVMSAGIPVIAFNNGGVDEIIQQGKNGILYSEYSSGSLNSAIERFENKKISKDYCIKVSNNFSISLFEEGIKRVIKRGMLLRHSKIAETY